MFGTGIANEAFARYFIGESFLNPLTDPKECPLFLANVTHWHGAKTDSWFSHIAIEIPGTNGSTEWCEPVDDEMYRRLS